MSLVYVKVNQNTEVEKNETKQSDENHFILLSLLNALFPDVKLQACLLLAATVSEVDYVLKEFVCDAFQAHSFHFDCALESLTHAK